MFFGHTFLIITNNFRYFYPKPGITRVSTLNFSLTCLHLLVMGRLVLQIQPPQFPHKKA